MVGTWKDGYMSVIEKDRRYGSSDKKDSNKIAVIIRETSDILCTSAESSTG